MDEPADAGTTRTDRPSPPPPAVARPPLRRDTEAGMLGGVAAGLAHHLAIDVVLIRIAFVVGTILTQGLGLLAYILCWIFVPRAEPGTQPPPRRTETPSDGRGSAFWVGVGLLTLGALWFLGAMPWPRLFGLGWLDGGVLVPLLLIGLGVALWRTSGRPAAADQPAPTTPATPGAPAAPTEQPGPPEATGPTGPTEPSEPGATASFAPPASSPTETTMPAPASPTSPPASPTSPPASAASPPASPPGAPTSDEAAERTQPFPPRDAEVDDTVRIDDAAWSEGATPPPPPPAAPSDQGDDFTPPPVQRKPRSLLTRVTLGLALVTVGILWILEVTTTLALGPLRIVAIGLAVVGAGLLVGSVVGRGRPLIIAGVLLLPVVLAGTLIRGLPGGEFVDATFLGTSGVGERTEQVVSVDRLESRYSLGAGSFRLDLSDLDLTEDASTLIEIGAGEVIVTVPPEVNVDARASLAGGEIRLFDRQRSGMAFDLRAFEPALTDDPTAAPTLRIRINGGFGDLRVQR